MNAVATIATILLKSVTNKTTTPRPTRPIEELISADRRRHLLAFAGRKLSKPMDPATALHLAQQRTRLIKWGAHVWPRR